MLVYQRVPQIAILIGNLWYGGILGISFSDQDFWFSNCQPTIEGKSSGHYVGHFPMWTHIFLILLEQIQGRQSLKMSTRRSWKNTRRQNTESVPQTGDYSCMHVFLNSTGYDRVGCLWNSETGDLLIGSNLNPPCFSNSLLSFPPRNRPPCRGDASNLACG